MPGKKHSRSHTLGHWYIGDLLSTATLSKDLWISVFLFALQKCVIKGATATIINLCHVEYKPNPDVSAVDVVGLLYLKGFFLSMPAGAC